MLGFLVGLALVVLVLFDVFQSIVLPRPSPTHFRPTGAVIWLGWMLCRWTALRQPSARFRELLLGTFAPLMVVGLLVLWVAGLIVGFGLMLYALVGEEHPVITDLGTAIYFSGVALLTVGFGDIAPTGGPARIIALVEAACGLGVVALVITFLFTLFGAFQRREILVITLSARAGAPPSGVTLLELFAKYQMPAELAQVFTDWETWSAEVLDSHLSYPLLAYFRSTHDSQSWVSALGAVLDAATLLLTTVEEGPRGPALLAYRVGVHLVEDLTQYFRIAERGGAYVERSEYEEAWRRLSAVGYRLRDADAAWLAFAKLREEYAGPLNAMASLWVTPPAQWIGDRSRLRVHAQPAHAR